MDSEKTYSIGYGSCYNFDDSINEDNFENDDHQDDGPSMQTSDGISMDTNDGTQHIVWYYDGQIYSVCCSQACTRHLKLIHRNYKDEELEAIKQTKQLFIGERVQAHGEVLGYREGDDDLESAPVGDFNPDADENYGDYVGEVAVNVGIDQVLPDDNAMEFLENDIVCILGRKCDHTGKAETMPLNCRNKDLMIGAIGRVCNTHQRGQQFDPRFEENVSPKRRVVEMTSIIRENIYMPMPLTKVQVAGGNVQAKERKFHIQLDVYEELMPVNLLVPLNRMRLLTEVLEDVDTPEDVREMLVQEGTEAENERIVDDMGEGRNKMLAIEENAFVDEDSDNSEEEDSGEVNEDHDESSDDEEICDDNSELDANIDGSSDDERGNAEAAVGNDNDS